MSCIRWVVEIPFNARMAKGTKQSFSCLVNLLEEKSFCFSFYEEINIVQLEIANQVELKLLLSETKLNLSSASLYLGDFMFKSTERLKGLGTDPTIRREPIDVGLKWKVRMKRGEREVCLFKFEFNPRKEKRMRFMLGEGLKMKNEDDEDKDEIKGLILVNNHIANKKGKSGHM
ncbi:hypothetical protein Tco_1546939 [Tanacetum coccineum]